MTPESEERWKRMDRMMEFILEQQAQADVRQAKAEERQAKAEERQAKAEERQAKAEERQAKNDEQIAALIVRQDRTDRQIVGLQKLMRTGMKLLVKQGERMNQLAAGQVELQTTLRAFIDSMTKGTNGHN